MKKIVYLFAALMMSISMLADDSIPGTVIMDGDTTTQTALITIDGDFSDWHLVASDRLAEVSLDEKSSIKGLYAIKFCADANYLYFYFEFSPEIYEQEGDSGTVIRGNRVENFDIMLDADGNENTGYNYSYQWSHSGADIMFEGTWTDNFAGAMAYYYNPTDTSRQAWTWEELGLTRPALSCQRVILNDGQAAIEGRLTRSVLTDTLTSVKVGVTTYNSQWSLTGVLPQQMIDATQGQVIEATMLEVPLIFSSIVDPDTTVINPDTTVVTPDLPNGLCGDSVAWILNEGVLTISGSGQMWHYSEEAPSAYSPYMQIIGKVIVQNGVSNIGDYAFANFFNLREIVIRGELESIGISALSGCSNLSAITCYSVNPPAIAGNMVFNEVPSSVNVFVPASALEAYKASRGWSVFENIQPIKDETEIVVTIFGLNIEIPDTIGEGGVNLLGDSTLMYDPEENTLTFNGLTMEVGDEVSTAISYSGSEPLTIVLNDSSTIFADTVIASLADIIIKGEGTLVAEGVVPIIGTSTAVITFDSVNMHVKSLPSPAAVRRRIKGAKKVDETGGPALSGFASADFNKTNVTPPDADYGEVEMEESAGGTSTVINTLYVTDDDGNKVVVTEFTLTAIADDVQAIEATRTKHTLDPQQPMYNILGTPVSAGYKGIVIQGGQTFIIL